MGKKLIIKGADFSANAIDLINWTDITSSITFNSSGKRQYIHYPGGSLSDAYQYQSSLSDSYRIAVADVSSYVGKRIKLHTSDSAKASSYQGGLYRKCFASAITSLPWTSTTNLQNAVTAVEHIDGKGGSASTAVDFILTVPQGAVYLVFTTTLQSQTTLAVEL